MRDSMSCCVGRGGETEGCALAHIGLHARAGRENDFCYAIFYDLCILLSMENFFVFFISALSRAVHRLCRRTQINTHTHTHTVSCIDSFSPFYFSFSVAEKCVYHGSNTNIYIYIYSSDSIIYRLCWVLDFFLSVPKCTLLLAVSPTYLLRFNEIL